MPRRPFLNCRWLGDSRHAARVWRRVLQWFDRHHRPLPWRSRPTPYRVWISEIMLHQTQVATVVPYYRRFLRRFPTVRRLAAADLDDVLHAWAGLGYYRRARQLHAAARAVVAEYNSRLPDNVAQLALLPGIGRYTASAIQSIARGRRVPVVEGNTLRLYSRLTGLRLDPRSARGTRLLWEEAEKWLPPRRCGDWTQALMEIGSRVCLPRHPRCDQCPLRPDCYAHRTGKTDRFPIIRGRPKPIECRESAVVLLRGNKAVMRRCRERERWSGLWDFPRRMNQSPIVNGRSRAELVDFVRCQTGLIAELSSPAFSLRHTVTRYRIRLDVYIVPAVRGKLRQSLPHLQWIRLDQLTHLPVTATTRQIIDRLADVSRRHAQKRP